MNIAIGLRIARQEMIKQAGLEKQAAAIPWQGMLGGTGAGIGHAALDLTNLLGKTHGEVAALAEHSPGMHKLITQNMRGGEAGAEKGLFHFADAEGKTVAHDAAGATLQHHAGAKGMDYLKAYGPHTLKRAASWAGGGGLVQVGLRAAKNQHLISQIGEYAPYAAAGVGGLAVYKALS